MAPPDSDTPNSGPAPSSPSPIGWTPPAVDEVDALVPGRYEVLELLGSGGMAAVYKARQTRLNRLVAIKILPQASVDDNDEMNFTQRFEQEARSMANLSHPGIVAVYDFGETETGLLYFVMEYVDGTDILGYLGDHGGTLPEEYARVITSHVLDALAFAHKNGVIHRDIKPANILINSEGHIKIADFGLAKLSAAPADSGLTMTNVAMGTPDFVAPEALITGSPVDHRADLYAVGVMLYQLLTGDMPRGRFQLPSEKIPTLDPRIDPIINRAMTAEPAGRYQSATEMRSDLDALASAPIAKVTPGAPSTAIPKKMQPPGAAASPAPKKKSPTVLALTIIAPLLLIAAAAFFFTNLNKEEPAPQKTAATPAEPTPKEKAPLPETEPQSKPAPPTKPTQPKVATTPTPESTPEPAPKPGPTPPKLAAVPKPDPTPTPPPTPPLEPTPPTSTSTTLANTQTENPEPATVNSAERPAGKLRAWGHGRGNTPPDIGAAAGHEDFVQVVVNEHGWAALRSNSEIHLTTWDYDKSQYTGQTKVIPSFRASFLLRGRHITFREIPSGNFRNIWYGASQKRTEWAHPDAVALVNPNNHLTAIDARGRITHTAPWGSNSSLTNPPDDFFLDAPAYTATSDHYIAARPGHPVRSWNVVTGSLSEFPEDIRNIVAIDAAVAQVILLDASGNVFVRHASGSPLPDDLAFLEPPADLPPAVAVRSGRRMCAAQFEGGYWIAWGQSPELVKQVSEIGPALDLDLHYEKDVSEFLIWIESTDPAAFPTRTTSTSTAPTSPFPPDITERLASIGAQYQKAYDRDIAPGHEAAVADLDTKYLAAVQRALAAAAQAGDLDASIALRNEVQRLDAAQPLPPLDLDSLPDSLKKLRLTYRDTLAGLESDRAAKAAPYEARRDQLYEAYQTELTKAGRIDDALAIKHWRESKTLTKPSPTSAATPSPRLRSPISNRGGDLQPVLDWAFRIGATLTISKGGTVTRATVPADLPPPPYDITAIVEYNGLKEETTDSDFASLAAISTLRRISFTDPKLKITSLAPLANHTALEDLELRYSGLPLNESEFIHLAGLTKLKAARLDVKEFTGEGLAHLANAKDLTYLTFRTTEGGSLTANGAGAIARLPALETLNLVGAVDRGNQESLAPLAGSPALKTLKLEDSELRPEGFSHIARIQGLETLDLRNTDIDNRGFAFLAPLAPTLKKLDMQTGATVSDRGIADIVANLPNLEFISTSTGSTCTKSSLVELAKLPNLKDILWWAPDMKERDYLLLGNFPAIENIHLGYGAKITDDGLATLKDCPRLEKLTLQGQPITDAAFPHLQAIKSLKTLDLRSTKVTPASLAAFQKARPNVRVSY